MINNLKITKKSGLKFLFYFSLTILILFNASFVSGQNTKQNKTLTEEELTELEVIYVGVDSPINLGLKGHNTSEYVFEIKDNVGKIKIRNHMGLCVVTPKWPGIITVVVKSEEKIIKEIRLNVKVFPNVVAIVNGQKGGVISKEDLLKQNELVVMTDNLDINEKYKVTGFTCSMKNSKGYYLSSKSESGEITEKQKEFIKSAQKDQMIVFEDIYAEGSNDRRKVSSIVFKIK